MSERAKALLRAYYYEPLSEYRKAIDEVCDSGGLTEDEVLTIGRAADPVDTMTIVRHVRSVRFEADYGVERKRHSA